MRSYENTFVRGPSPSYSDEGASAFSSNQPHLNLENSFDDEKCTGTYVGVVKQGRNTFAFWTVVVVLLILTVGNLMITLSIIGVLHLGRGIRGLELIPEENTIKFYGSTDLDRIYMKATPQIDSFTDIPVTIEADGGGGGVNLSFQRNNGQLYNRLIMDEGGIQFRAINSFEIKDPESGNTIFTTHRPHYNMAGSAESLLSKAVSVSRITSELDESLKVEGDSHIGIKGSEGIAVDGANIVLQAEQSLLINGTQTVFEGPIYLDMDKLKRNIVSSEFGLRTGNVQYKLCVCMPQGQLFRIAIPRVHNGPKITCAHFSPTVDPCATN